MWKYPTAGWVASSPTLLPDGSALFIGSDDGHLYNLRTKDGSLSWKQNLSNPTPEPGPPCSGVQGTPAVSPTGTLVAVGACNGVVWMLGAAAGEVRWSRATGGSVVSSPTFSHNGSTIYIGSNDHYVRALDTVTGAVMWAFATKGEIQSSAQLSQDGRML